MEFNKDLWKILFHKNVYDDYTKSNYYSPYNSNYGKFLEECVGIYYEQNNYGQTKIIDKQKYLLAKIKYGI